MAAADPHDRFGYTVDAVRRALSDAAGAQADTSAFECFAGYLLVDAVVGNTDRHQENWAVIENTAGQRRLAPSFDHASSLGFLLSDSARTTMLTTADRNQTPQAWAARARTRFEGHPHPVEVAASAMAHLEPETVTAWVRSIEQLDLAAIVARVPSSRMTGPAREFAVRVAEANRAHIMSHPARTMDP